MFLRVKSLADLIRLYIAAFLRNLSPLVPPQCWSRSPNAECKPAQPIMFKLFLPFFVMSSVAACKGPPKPTGLVIVGGDLDGGTSAEVCSPKKLCRLPPLVHTIFSPTVNALSHRVIACDGAACFELRKKPTAEIAKEAKASHADRKKDAGRRKPKKVKELPRGSRRRPD